MKLYNQDALEEAWLKGLDLFEQGQYQAAIDCFEHVHLLYLAQGQVEEALPVMMKLIHLHLLLENWPVLQVYLQTVSDKELKGSTTHSPGHYPTGEASQARPTVLVYY